MLAMVPAAALVTLAGCVSAGQTVAAEETQTPGAAMLDFKSLEKASSPNRWLIAPSFYLEASQPDAEAPTFNQDRQTAFAAVEAAINDEPRVSERLIDRERFQLRYTATVPLFRFKDDVDIAVLPGADPNTSTIAIYSRSRVGHSDLGVNKHRAESILRTIKSKL